MSHFITFSYPDRKTRITVRIDLHGKTDVVVTDHAGLMIERRTSAIDERDARRIVEDTFSFAPRLDSRPNGTLFISIGAASERRDYVVTEYDLPHRGLEIARIVPLIARDILAGQEVRSTRRQGGPTQARMTLSSFLMWTIAFAVAFVASCIVGNIGLIIGALTGPFMFAACNSIAILLMAGSFYGVGQKFGEHFRGNAYVVLPAIAATLPLVYVWAKVAGAGAFYAVTFMCMMPFVAFHGDRSGY